MQKVWFDDRFMSDFVSSDELEHYNPAVESAQKMLENKSGPGNDFLGWLELPKAIDPATLKQISEKAEQIRSKADVLICVGIGGSYLGAKAAIEYLSPSFEQMRKPQIIFAGHTINSDYLSDLLESLKDKEVAVNVISKSGTTTEPGIAFRVIRHWMEQRYGRKEAASRIIATTDPSKGALRKLANEEGYSAFEIPGDVGGRFSVLTPVGLFPIAVAGIDIKKLMEGASQGYDLFKGRDIQSNIAGRYAAMRNILFRRGYTTEVMATFQPQLHFINEWWKQLAGESEGKDGTGIFPAGLDYTTDLHSLGQWMQEGVRSVFETFMLIKNTRSSICVPAFDDDSDGLNYLAGKTFEDINNKAYQGTLLAHLDGGVPVSTLMLEDRSEQTLGQLFYFFEKAVALSGYILRVNPFDQPGVEAYKKNMFALLGKAGFEKQREALAQRTKDMGV
ncbi:glucose-6-phosphate isomerase [Chitinispirillales bacterium ANBcel5]|uniref:glucose-6-phosphate isomerase n=1 Tax=Cellulosispirillum alkaliphilum TaxID=3039283 RepID=UPI002A57B340|nr:glucose-6-phosphate isomerase [Chitinispirillales bacterium ANBcel5]